jgi:hypothetical protein
MGGNQFHLSPVYTKNDGENKSKECDAAPLLQFECSCWEIRHHLLSSRNLDEPAAPSQKIKQGEGDQHSIRGESIRLHNTRVP